jgi:hypothetical protein
MLWCILLEGLKKTTESSVKIANFPEEIQTEHLLNTILTAAIAGWSSRVVIDE